MTSRILSGNSLLCYLEESQLLDSESELQVWFAHLNLHEFPDNDFPDGGQIADFLFSKIDFPEIQLFLLLIERKRFEPWTEKSEPVFFQELIEAGIVLKGSEIKSVRSGKINIAESYAVEKKGEIFLVNSHIPAYKQASYSNHDPYSERKLLFNRKEINKLIGSVNEDGLSLVPTKMYFKKGKAKIEIAVAKGKKKYDKRNTKKTRDWNRQKARYFRKSS